MDRQLYIYQVGGKLYEWMNVFWKIFLWRAGEVAGYQMREMNKYLSVVLAAEVGGVGMNLDPIIYQHCSVETPILRQHSPFILQLLSFLHSYCHLQLPCSPFHAWLTPLLCIWDGQRGAGWWHIGHWVTTQHSAWLPLPWWCSHGHMWCRPLVNIRINQIVSSEEQWPISYLSLSTYQWSHMLCPLSNISRGQSSKRHQYQDL